MSMKVLAHFEIAAYSETGDQLSLSANPGLPEILRSDDLREAIKIATDARSGWMHWDDGDSEEMAVGCTVLRHIETRNGPRGGVVCSVHELERVSRK